MNTNATQLLIAEVQSCPALYDKRHRLTKGAASKKEIWDAIGAKIGLSGDAAKKRWRYIRDAFLFSIKRGRVKLEEKASKVKPYKFAKELEFLVPYVTGKDGRTTVDLELVNQILKGENDTLVENEVNILEPRIEVEMTNCATDSGAASSPTDNLSSPEYQRVVPSEPEDLQPHQTSRTAVEKPMIELQSVNVHEMTKKLDETDTFFLAMASMVKMLPIRTQAKIKFELHKLIHQAEMELLPFQLPSAQSQPAVGLDPGSFSKS